LKQQRHGDTFTPIGGASVIDAIPVVFLPTTATTSQLADFARRLNPTRPTKLSCDSKEACSRQRL
jgi:hypothetical protein